MLLRKPSGRPVLSRSILARPARIRFLVIILLYSFGLFVLGGLAHRSDLFALARPSLWLEGLRSARNYLVSLSQHPEGIQIDIKHKHFQKLAHNREMALATGTLLVEHNEEVPATIRYRGDEIPVKIRLKGDLKDHYEHPYRWSFRIQTRGETTILGMKRFSIQRPQTRRWIYEWLFHQVAKREGLLSLRYEFIDVVLNGKKLGTYALEEHFEKRLVEHNERRAGPIVRFDEENWWKERVGFDHDMDKYWPGTGDYYTSHIDGFSTDPVLSDSTLFRQFQTAVTLLEGFRSGVLATSEVFDVDALAKYVALCDLFGSPHPISLNQFRCYYNPITSRLEPIPFDVDGGIALHRIASAWSKDMDSVWHGGRRVMFVRALFNDLAFFDRYVQELDRYSQPAYLDSLFADLSAGLRENTEIIHRTYPGYRFSNRVLYDNQEHIRRFLAPVNGFHAYFGRADDGVIALELGAIQHIPVEIFSISYKDSLVIRPARETVLLGRDASDPVQYQTVEFALPKGFQWSSSMAPDLKVDYKLLGTNQLRSETVFPWRPADYDILTSDLMRQSPNVEDFEFLQLDEAAHQIVVRSGRWNVTHNLIIPGGYQVIAGQGVALNLTHSASIVSYSMLRFVGSPEAPIVLSSADSTGKGLLVVNAHEQSVLENVRFENLSNPSQPGLTGAVTFYESPVTIVECHFAGNHSEDALNIVRSTFVIHSTVFSQTSADAFDADFAKGEIHRTSFIDCGNDALDVSGSVVEADDIVINGTGDKGISVGENSNLVAERVRIQHAAIAVAGKDMSNVVLQDVEISDGEVGIAVFRKKPEFGGATVQLTGLTMERVKLPYAVEPGSRLTLDDRAIAANHDNVESILYGAVYGKSSR